MSEKSRSFLYLENLIDKRGNNQGIIISKNYNESGLKDIDRFIQKRLHYNKKYRSPFLDSPTQIMTQIPRKPTFPSYMVQKLRAKIQSDVQDDVIPVSTGIYSYQKLKNKLEAIPKPQIQNYQDKIFFQIIEDRLVLVDKTGQNCTSCDQDYNKKNQPIMCNFCGVRYCSNCIPARKRPHPLSKDGSGKRYNICQRCDTKYLNLQLGHSYVQNRTLLEQAIVKTSEELQKLMNQSQEYQELLTKCKQSFDKNRFKISQLRKQKLELTKQIKSRMPEQMKLAEETQEELKVKFVEIHLKHKEWLELNQVKRIEKEERQRLRIRQKQQQEERRRLVQIERQRKLKQQQYVQRTQREKHRQEQEQQRNIQKIKRTPSLQQNSTLSLNLTYTNPHLEPQKDLSQSDLNEKTKTQNIQKKRSNDYGGYDSYRRQESQQQQQVRVRQLSKTSLGNSQHPFNHNHYAQTSHQSQTQFNSQVESQSLKRQIDQNVLEPSLSIRQSQFAQYFRQSHSQPQTINQSTFKQQIIQANNQQPQQQNVQTENYAETDNFTFNDKYYIPNHQNVDSTTSCQQQYTFQAKKIQNQIRGVDLEQEHEEIPISVPQAYHSQQQQENNKLSYIDQWYVGKSNSISNSNLIRNKGQQDGWKGNAVRQTSSLSTALSSAGSKNAYGQRMNSNGMKNKTQQELEEECMKSTSELDEQELQVARYSLIKAARDSAVEQRQRNKIYQKSIYQTESAPYDPQQAEGVGQIKKCQCSIY